MSNVSPILQIMQLLLGLGNMGGGSAGGMFGTSGTNTGGVDIGNITGPGLYGGPGGTSSLLQLLLGQQQPQSPLTTQPSAPVTPGGTTPTLPTSPTFTAPPGGWENILGPLHYGGPQ